MSEEDLAANFTSQLMICILVDASYSMNMNDRIGAVNRGIKEFIARGREDILARDSMDVCIIAFGGNGAEVKNEFTNVTSLKYENIVPHGGTPLADALDFALEKIDARYKYWQAAGNPLYHPWLIVLSDGRSDQDISKQAERIQSMYRAHKLKGCCIAVGEGTDQEDLKKIAPNDKVDTFDSFELFTFFNMLSRSAVALSASSPDLDTSDASIKVTDAQR